VIVLVTKTEVPPLEWLFALQTTTTIFDPISLVPLFVVVVVVYHDDTGVVQLQFEVLIIRSDTLQRVDGCHCCIGVIVPERRLGMTRVEYNVGYNLRRFVSVS
jgi:hypothetical protein